MRIGLSIAEPPPGADVLGALAESLQLAHDDGFASAWMANIFGLDALTALAVVGSRVPEIELGTAVVPTYPRHPGALAQQALVCLEPLHLTPALIQGHHANAAQVHEQEHLVSLPPKVVGERGEAGLLPLRGERSR